MNPTAPVTPYLFPIYGTREDLRKAGTEAPVADATWGEQNWCDPNAKPDAFGNTHYKRMPYNWEPLALQHFKVPTVRAKQYNLAGAPIFPAYTIPDLGDTISSGGGLNPDMLSTREQAIKLQTEFGLGGTVMEEKGPNPDSAYVYVPAETRRVWVIALETVAFNVGMYLKEKYAMGVGYPMHWDTSDLSHPMAVYGPLNQSTANNRVPWPAYIPEGYKLVDLFGIITIVKA